MNRRKVMPCLDALDTKSRGVIKNCLQNLPPEEVLDASSLLHGHALLVSHCTPLSLNPKTLLSMTPSCAWQATNNPVVAFWASAVE